MSSSIDGHAVSAAPGGGTVRLTAAEALVRYLAVQHSERDGTRRRVIAGMFGIFGHGNVCGVGPALEEDDEGLMPFYQPKNEQAMVHTAIGYAKGSSLLSTLACTASIGPGSTNMLTGAATATVNRVPVLLLPSDTFANRRQGPVMQALEHPAQADVTVNDCFRPLSRYFDRISRPEQLLTALPEAMRVLLEPAETGAVTISLHQDVQAEAAEFPARFFEPRTWHVERRPPAPAEIAGAVELIRHAERPLIVAGGGVHYSEATAELAALATEFGIPVAETSAGKGALVDAGLPVGALGHSGTRAANALAVDADLVICIGTRLIDLITGSHTVFQDPAVRFVGLNVCAADAYKLGAAPVVGDARASLEGLSDVLRATGWRAPEAWRERAGEVWTRWARELDADLAPRPGERMSQGQALRALNEAVEADDQLVVASGTPHVDVHKLWDCGHGERCYMEVGFSCMGHEIPSALGVRLASGADGEIFVVIGDGTYLMGATELVTAVQEGLKITVLVMVNHGYQSIHALQRSRTGRSFGLEFRERTANEGLAGEYLDIGYAANARSLGCAAFEAGSLDELEQAVRSARAESRASVIVCHVEPHRLLLDSECWWDVGVAEVSDRPETRALAAEHARGRARQRFYG